MVPPSTASATTPRRSTPYALKTPCANCPFRSDIPKYLRPDRVREIANSLRQGADFPCHKTTVDRDDDERDYGPGTKSCAGALVTMEREGFSNQLVRIGERLGLYDAERLDMDAPVYGSLSEWVRSFSDGPTTVTTDDGDVLEYEHCGAVGPDCIDPAGYDFGGSVTDNDDEPTCHPVDDCCSYCGYPACSECLTTDEHDNPICVTCADND